MYPEMLPVRHDDSLFSVTPKSNPFAGSTNSVLSSSVRKSPLEAFLETLHACAQDPALLKDIIEKRILSLSPTCPDAAHPVIGLDTIFFRRHTIHSDFIPAATPTCAGVTARPLFVNDDEIFLNAVRAYLCHTQEQRAQRPALYMVSDAVQQTVVDYFGWFKKGAEAECNALRMQGAELSIRDFKGKEIALCFERSVAAHNLFRFFGIDARLVLTRARLGSEMAHAFNLLLDAESTPKGSAAYIVDVTNPKIIERGNAKITIEPAIYSISRRQLHALWVGKGIWVDHLDYVPTSAGHYIWATSKRRYGYPNTPRRLMHAAFELLKALGEAESLPDSFR